MNKSSCLIVFSPKNIKEYNNRKRFLVSSKRLHVYIGDKNARNVNITANFMRTDKRTVKLRKYGKIEIYVK